ncbi:MAG TPA: DUF302 domain-containing protein [Stellaceae bacterium]|nr:DUF302 domain-containing protein [Stellaceae bacterium]
MMPQGMTSYRSRFDPAETMSRLEAAVMQRGISVLARVDHAGAASKVGMELRPTAVLIFGNPRAGTPLMQAVQTIGIDLPLRTLVWQDAEGATWLAYNEPAWLAARHGAAEGHERALAAMADGLAAIAKEATGA